MATILPRNTHHSIQPESTSWQGLMIETLEFVLKKLIELSDIIRKSHTGKQTGRNIITINQKKTLNLSRNSQSELVPSIKSDIQTMMMKIDSFKMSHSPQSWNSESPNNKHSFEYEQNQINMLRLEQSLLREITNLKDRIGTMEEDIGQMLMLYKDVIFDQ